MNIPGRRISEGEVVITDPFARGGDGMFLRAQLIDKGGATPGTVTVAVFTRNREEDWPTTGIASLAVGTTEGTVYEMEVAPGSIKQELRLKITGASDGWSVIRIFQPLFFDAAIGTL